MFGSYYFGQPYFGQGPEEVAYTFNLAGLKNAVTRSLIALRSTVSQIGRRSTIRIS